jgi:hypothetical protein
LWRVNGPEDPRATIRAIIAIENFVMYVLLSADEFGGHSLSRMAVEV